MADTGPPAGWYDDPAGSGQQRYWAGDEWTEHVATVAPPIYAPPVVPMFIPHWKGMRHGRPPSGPERWPTPASVSAPRLLDMLILSPVLITLIVVAVVNITPRAGVLFPKIPTNSNQPLAFPGFVWIELGIVGAFLATGLVMIVYQATTTVRWGRSPGKAACHLRPITTTGESLGWGKAFGREAIYWVFGILNLLAVIDSLWCLWDDDHQCLHDKVAGTLVVNEGDPVEPSAIAPYYGAGVASPSAPLGVRWIAQPVGAPGLGFQAPVTTARNGLATASLVCSIGGLILFGVPAALGVVLGFVARAQIRRTNGHQLGSGLALAGIIIGFTGSLFWLLALIGALVGPQH